MVNCINFGEDNVVKQPVKVFKELVTENGTICLDILNGSAICKYFSKESELETAISQIESTFATKVLIMNDNPQHLFLDSADKLAGTYFQGVCDLINNYKKSIDNIMLLSDRKNTDVCSDSLEVTIMPRYLVFDVQHMCIKLPVQYKVNGQTEENSGVNISVKGEWLVQPQGTICEETLELLQKVYPENKEQIIEFYNLHQELLVALKNNQCLYSVQYYNYLQKEYFYKSLSTKAIINAIRMNDTQSVFSPMYRILQLNRMQERVGIECTKYNYKGSYASVKFKEYLESFRPEGVDGDIMQVFTQLSTNKQFREDQLNTYFSFDELKPLGIFIKHYGNESPNKDAEAMAEYDSRESERLVIQREIWLQHFLIRHGERSWESYLNIYTDDCVRINPLQSKTWYAKCNISTEDKNVFDKVEIKVNRYKPRGGNN